MSALKMIKHMQTKRMFLKESLNTLVSIFLSFLLNGFFIKYYWVSISCLLRQQHKNGAKIKPLHYYCLAAFMPTHITITPAAIRT